MTCQIPLSVIFVFRKFNQHGCKSRGEWGMYPSINVAASPLNIFYGSEKFPIQANFISRYQKMISLLNHPPQYQKVVNFAKSSHPMLNIDLHSCQSSVILATLFKSCSADQNTLSTFVVTALTLLSSDLIG